MNLKETMMRLSEKGNDSFKKIYLSHGAREPLFGVKMGDLRTLAKKIGIDHPLALELYATGNSDAMMLAIMIVDPQQVDETLLDRWVSLAYWDMLSERGIAELASSTANAWQMAEKWIQSKDEMTACAGYSIYMILFTRIDNSLIDIEKVKAMLLSMSNRIQHEMPHLQYAMNNCLIMAGIHIDPIYEFCLELANSIGYVKPTVAINNCNIQSAGDYLLRYRGKKKAKSK